MEFQLVVRLIDQENAHLVEGEHVLQALEDDVLHLVYIQGRIHNGGDLIEVGTFLKSLLQLRGSLFDLDLERLSDSCSAAIASRIP